jgi:hypothetical protein
MLLDPFLYDFVADHQRALRKAAEWAPPGRARVLCWRPVVFCLRRFTSWGIPSGIRPPSRRRRFLGRALWFFNLALADHDSRTSAWGPSFDVDERPGFKIGANGIARKIRGALGLRMRNLALQTV